MKLLTHPVSLFPLRVAIALHEKGVSYDGVLTDPGEAAPEFLGMNPFGQIPVLVDGDITIAESMAILEYLEEKFPEPALAPSDLRQRAEMRQLMGWSTDYWYAHWRNWLAPRIGGDGSWSEESVEAARAGLCLHLDLLERNLESRAWLVGDYSLADICYAPLVLSLERVGFGDAFEARPKVRDWLRRLEARKAVADALAAHASGGSTRS